MPNNSAQKHEKASHHLLLSTAKENKLLSKSSIRRKGLCFCKSISSCAFIVVAHLDAWLHTWMNAFVNTKKLGDGLLLLSGPPNCNSFPLSGVLLHAIKLNTAPRIKHGYGMARGEGPGLPAANIQHCLLSLTDAKQLCLKT